MRLSRSGVIVDFSDPMRGAGISYKKKRFITHTTLSLRESALQRLNFSQFVVLLILFALVILSVLFFPLSGLRIFVTILTVLYFCDTVFNFYLILRSVRKPVEISFTQEELKNIRNAKLPIYTILCPLYREARVLPQFLQAIEKLDWPKTKLDVMLLIEKDDTETRNAIKSMSLPSYVRVITVPHSYPKTKPKACNYGLSFAKGNFLVIYDAEDIPDPLQLKKAYAGFMTLPKDIYCLQAKLNYYNPNQNFLTRLFTAEYSLWFDLILTGLQSLNSAIPLGGTSNHFRTSELRELQGWDTFNVTEDADLGVRLFKKGHKTAIIDSTTLEEANSNMFNWFRQRSRWIKGYIQTYLVHTRDFPRFIKENGFRHAFIFQMTIGGKLLFLFINPILWVITFLYFAFYDSIGKFIELVYYPPMSYLAVFSLVFGNFLSFYYYMIALGRRSQWGLVKYVYFIPFYWIMMSYGGIIALYQLVFRPFYWEKTIHGFHLKKVRTMPLFNPFKPVIFYYVLFILADVLLIWALYPDSVISKYFYLSFIGKGIYIVSLFFSFFTLSFLRLRYILFSTFLISWIGVVLFGIELLPVMPELLPYTIAMTCFALSNVFVLFSLRKRIYSFLSVAYFTTLLQLAVIFLTHTDLPHAVWMITYLAGAQMLFMFTLHLNKKYLRIFENNLRSFFGLLSNDSIRESWEKKEMRILIFNWRDTKHRFAGGAEVYVRELARRWVRQGNKVTLFCGNDNRNPGNEIIDGIEIIRRGGIYSVYFFAFIYYLFKFRGRYDLVIDCENGIPFFTPLYVREPVILVIHHVHQEIIRKYLHFPLNQIAAVLEAKLMPSIYRNKTVVTVSQSSKEEIIRLGFTDERNIEIIYNGTSVKNGFHSFKTKYPLFLYLGRLQDYKNIDVAINAFAKVVKEYKEARLKIAGFGESLIKLKRLAVRLGILDKVIFLGKVSDKEKEFLLSKAWVVLQPSQIEGWGITVIEANACKTPVIASRVPGLCDSVIDGRTGILVNYGDVRAFTSAMKQLIQNPGLRRKLSRQAYLWAGNFSWTKSANLFYSLIGRSIPYPDYNLKKPVYARFKIEN